MAYNVSRLLADLLKPLMGMTEYFVKNTASCSKDLKGIKLDEVEIMNSHDSLWCRSLPMFSSHGRRLRLDNSLHKRLLAGNVMELLEFVLDSTYFSYGGKIHGQIQGAPMGSPGSVVVANRFVKDHEETSIATAPPQMKPKIWRMYVHDSFEIVKTRPKRPVYCPLK